MDWRAKVELFEQIRREYEFGVGTIAGVAHKLGVHRRMVRAVARDSDSRYSASALVCSLSTLVFSCSSCIGRIPGLTPSVRPPYNSLESVGRR